MENHGDIYHHAHPDQEIGYEKGIAHELDGVHQGGVCRHIAVYHQTGEECAQHRLKADQPRHPCREEYQRQDEDVLGDFLAVILEEPACKPRICIQHRAAVYTQLDHEPCHGSGLESASGVYVYRRRQHQQGADYGYDGSHHRDKHRRGLGDAETRRHGVGYQRVRGEHRRQQESRKPACVQHPHAGGHTHNHRYEKREHAEYHAAPEVQPQVIHVDLKSGQEHQVQQTHLPENLE